MWRIEHIFPLPKTTGRMRKTLVTKTKTMMIGINAAVEGAKVTVNQIIAIVNEANTMVKIDR